MAKSSLLNRRKSQSLRTRFEASISIDKLNIKYLKGHTSTVNINDSAVDSTVYHIVYTQEK